MKGQDILVMLKLLGAEGGPWSFSSLAHDLGMSPSEVHGAVKRCEKAGLYSPGSKGPRKAALLEFLIHGLRYVFPASLGPPVQGLPTSYAAPPLSAQLRFDPAEIPVMPLLRGPARGPEIAPIYRSAPLAASRDEALYQCLALVDALRSGQARERNLAAVELGNRLRS